MTTEPARRYYYRCTGCLEVYALPTALQMSSGRTVAHCGNCDQLMEFMGRVERDRLVTDHTACACDDRCTAARGPICTCKCNGKNHGAGLSATVTTTHDRGPVPIVKSDNPFRLTKSLEQYRRYRKMLEPIMAERNVLLDRKRAGSLPAPDFARMRALCAAVIKAEHSRSHNGRLRILEPFAPAPVEPITPVSAVSNDVTRAIATAPPIADVPFALTPTVAQRKSIQTNLF